MSDTRPYRGLPRAFWILLAGLFVNRAGGFVAPFLALYLTRERHIGVPEAGSLIALLGLGSLGSGPTAGFVSDRWGRRAALALSTFGGAASMLALGLSHSAVTLGPAVLAAGFFGEMYRTPCQAMVADLVPGPERERAFGLVYWSINAGFSLAPTLAGMIATRSFPALFLGDAATTLLFGLAVVLLVPETRPPAHHASRTLAEYLAPYRHGLFLSFLVAGMLISMLFHQVGTTLPLDMQAHGVAQATYGRILSLNGLLIVALQPFVSRVTRRLPRVRVLTTAAVLVGIGLSINALADGSIPIYVTSLVVWTAGEVIMAGATPAIIADLAPTHLRGSYQGAFTFALGLAAALASLGGCAILDRYGSAALWSSCLGIGLLAAVGYARTVPRASPARAGVTGA